MRAVAVAFWSFLAVFCVTYLASVICGCGGAPPVVQTAQTVRSSARAAVDLSKDAWVLLANGCVTVAQSEAANEKIATACGDYLVPAHDLIVAAGEAVDTGWNNGASCDLAQAVDLLGSAVKAVGVALPSGIAPTVADAVAVAHALAQSAQCKASDAGAE